MKQIPDNLRAYKQSQKYTTRSTPGMMKNDHRTRAGVWAKIVVEKGEIIYEITDHDEVHTLTPDNPGVIEPVVFHKIDPQPGARFYLEFYRQ